MTSIRLHDKNFKLYIPAVKIHKAIDEVAERLNQDLQHEDCPIFLSILNGSFMFTADLVRRMNFNIELSFIKVSSYCGMSSTNKIEQLIGLNASIEGRTVVIIEDIVDTGVTIEKLIALLKERKPKQIKICTLLLKPEQYKKNIHLDYVALTVPNAFIIGYGLDYNSLGRQLPDLYVIDGQE